MPTIVLLPFGRMLVVDRSVFAQMEADDTGLDFLELSANVIRAHHNYLMQHDQQQQQQHQQQNTEYPHHQSSNDGSKADLTLSQISIEHHPPTYEEIFGGVKSNGAISELPPSYSEANLLLRQLVRTGSLNILQPILRTTGPRNNYSFSTRTVNDSILVHYESERRRYPWLRSHGRFVVTQQQPHAQQVDNLDMMSADIDDVQSSMTQRCSCDADFVSSEGGTPCNGHPYLSSRQSSILQDGSIDSTGTGDVVLVINNDDLDSSVITAMK